MKQKMIKWIGVILMLSMLTSLCACTPGQEHADTQQTYRVAMAIADITPTRDVYLDGYEAHDESSLAVYPTNFTSDLKARVLIVDNGEDRLVFVNLEMVFSDSEYSAHNLSTYTLEEIAKVCDTSKENVLLSNTHNHQANMTLADAQESNILEAVKEAYNRLAPAKVGVTTVNTEFGISRGSDYTADENAPYDSLMSVIRFDNAQTGAPIGLIYSVPMHNTMFGNGPGLKANHNLLSCEFTGYASRAMEQKMASVNPNFTAMHINGFYGNAGPWAEGKWYAGETEQLQKNGESFAEEIMEGFEAIRTEYVIGDITTKVVEDAIPTHKTNQDFRQQFGDYDEMPLIVKLGTFGEIAFVGVNYEPFSIIGARLKAEAPYTTVIPAGNVNGWKGYIPTKEIVALHEQGIKQAECVPTKSPFDADGEEAFYSKVLTAVCDQAGVNIERVPMTAQGVETVKKSAVYTYALDRAQELDKLVISFGQTFRTDCAQDFELLVFDDQDQLVCSQSFDGSTVNYLGVFLNGAKAAKATLIVTERYGSGKDGIDALQPELYGIIFSEK